MKTQTVWILAVLGCLAVASAEPIRRKDVRIEGSPVGKCPTKDGEYPIYLPDANDCNFFYECSNGVPNQKQCLPGLCFDSTLNVCGFPQEEEEKIEAAPFNAVGTCPPRDTNETIYLQDSANCTIYYICSNGNAIQNVCPPDMAWNNNAHICDWELDANCNNDGSRKFAPFDAVGTCPPRDTNETVYLPDASNCTLYYICSNGKPIQNVCPPDMAWNNVAHICDWEIDANCDSNGLYIAPKTAVGTCPPRDTNVTIFLPDSSNCTVYYICSNGRPIQTACSPGMFWNPEVNVCDWAIDVECKISRKSPRSAVGTCPDVDPEKPIYLPDSDSCKLYYECSGGIPIQNECPDDLEFNPTLSVCDYYLDAGCTAGNSSSSSTSSTSSSSTSSSTSTTTTPAESTQLF